MSEGARGRGYDPACRGSLPGHAEDAPGPADAATSEEWWVPPPPDDQLSGGRPGTAGLASMGAILRGARSIDEGPRDVAEERPGRAEGDPGIWELPGFFLKQECGRGGTGVVYLAEQVGLGRCVALKCLRPELAASEGQRARFLAEARALARLQHPNIVQVFQTGDFRGRAYIVEEFVAGGGLDGELAKRPRSARPAAALVATLARAVEYAHRRGVLHRDLKPSNVLLMEDGLPKISDFGLAKLMDCDGEPGQTQTGSILGSPSYMAPEQALGRSAEVGPAADIYALGAILYETLTGLPPFLAASPLETLELVRTSEPVPPRRIQPGLPPALEIICLKCLAKDPARRYPTAEAMADDLDRFLAGLPILARPTPRAERLARWIRRHPATAAGSAVSALAAVALIAGSVAYQGLLRSALHRAEDNAGRALAQERRAEARYQAASETLDRMLGHLRDRRFAQTPRLRELLRIQFDDALAFYSRVAADRNESDPAVRFDLAWARLQSAQIQQKLGRGVEAAANARGALPALKDLVREEPGRPDYLFALARCYRTIAIFSAKPEVELRLAEALLVDLIRKFPARAEYRSELAQARNNLGDVYNRAKDLSQAAVEYGRAIEDFRTLLGRSASAGEVDARILLAENHRNLAVILQQGPRGDEALENYAASRRLLSEVLSLEPNQDEAALALGGTLFNEAIYLAADPSRRREAGRLFDEAIDRVTPVLRREPDWQTARAELLAAHGGRAQLLQSEGRFREAVRDWGRVIELEDSPAQREHFRFFLALAKAWAGDHRGAWELVGALEPGLDRRPPDYAVHLAQVCDRAAAAASADGSLPEAERAGLASDYARRGVALLHRALGRQNDDERAGLRETFRDDAAWIALRTLPEFRDLMTDAPGLPAATPGAAPGPARNR